MKSPDAPQAALQASFISHLLAAVLLAFSMSALMQLCFLTYPAESLHFQHTSLNNNSDLSDFNFVKEGSWYTGARPGATVSGVWLTPDPRNGQSSRKESNMGRFVYKDRIQFMNRSGDYPEKIASFNTSFSFQIITTGAYGDDGSGMAFFISDSEEAPINSGGGGLGLLGRVSPLGQGSRNSTNFFAVEFDTMQSSDIIDLDKEPSDSHIGIDINSLLSLKVIDTSPNSTSGFYPQLYLYNNYSFTAWIEYTSFKNLIQVWMTNSSSSQRPPRPCLELSPDVDLSTVFQDFMYIGFSASNEVTEFSMEGHVLYSWSFSSEDLNIVSEPPSTSESPPAKHHKLLVPLSGSTASILLALGILGIVSFCILRRRRSVSHTVNSGLQNHNKQLAFAPRYRYKDLRRAAHGFTDRNKIGEGGFSSVYKATLPDGSSMAIKKLKEGLRKEEEFSSEMNIISSIRHRNLLELQGWCYEKGEAMLVYKYMSNGSLDSYIYGEKRGTLQSETRLRILAGVALALDYLHSGLGECVLHRDVKAANVLLTEDFEPMLGDFGLARLIGHDQGAVTMTAVGTPGYVAPEVVYAGRVTEKADVYSFGVFALEIACGRRAITMQTQVVRLVDTVWCLHRDNKLMEALDPSMSTGMPPGHKEQWRCVVHVALMCCSPSPESRPSMRQVSQALEGDTMLLMQPLPATMSLIYPTAPISLPSASGSSTSGTVIISPSLASTNTTSTL